MLSGDLRYIELLKRTYPIIEAHRHDIGDRTYKNMFAADTEIKNLFKNTPPEQSQRLIDTIIFYCTEVDNFKLVFDKLDIIAHIHIQHGIKNEYYPIMKQAFKKAICDSLDVDETDELVIAWIYGLDKLSQELIHVENLIRKHTKVDPLSDAYLW